MSKADTDNSASGTDANDAKDNLRKVARELHARKFELVRSGAPREEIVALEDEVLALIQVIRSL